MVDFGPTAGDYARHRAGFPPELFNRLEAGHWCEPGHRALDLGTGPGPHQPNHLHVVGQGGTGFFVVIA